MKIRVDEDDIHLATGGREHLEGQPWLFFLHGAGNSHLTWVSQTRALAYDGYNVAAPDMPGHNLSAGKPIEGVSQQAGWVLRLMDNLGCKNAVFIGHSQGGLIALEIARQAPHRVDGIVFIGTAASIPVNPALIDMAESRQDKAIRAMIDWGHGTSAHMHDNSWPGASNIFLGVDVMRQNVSGALPIDLKSCAEYSDGLKIAAEITCPTACIFAAEDKMTPLKAGKALAAALPETRLHVIARSGHMIPVERPREVNAILREFLGGLDARQAA